MVATIQADADSGVSFGEQERSLSCARAAWCMCGPHTVMQTDLLESEVEVVGSGYVLQEVWSCGLIHCIPFLCTAEQSPTA